MLAFFPLPPCGQGNRIWQRRAFPPLPSGRGGDPSHQRWEGEGEQRQRCLLQETTRKLRVPLTLPRLRRGSLPLSVGARECRGFGQMRLPCLRGEGIERTSPRRERVLDGGPLLLRRVEGFHRQEIWRDRAGHRDVEDLRGERGVGGVE